MTGMYLKKLSFKKITSVLFIFYIFCIRSASCKEETSSVYLIQNVGFFLPYSTILIKVLNALHRCKIREDADGTKVFTLLFKLKISEILAYR